MERPRGGEHRCGGTSEGRVGPPGSHLARALPTQALCDPELVTCPLWASAPPLQRVPSCTFPDTQRGGDVSGRRVQGLLRGLGVRGPGGLQGTGGEAAGAFLLRGTVGNQPHPVFTASPTLRPRRRAQAAGTPMGCRGVAARASGQSHCVSSALSPNWTDSAVLGLAQTPPLLLPCVPGSQTRPAAPGRTELV